MVALAYVAGAALLLLAGVVGTEMAVMAVVVCATLATIGFLATYASGANNHVTSTLRFVVGGFLAIGINYLAQYVVSSWSNFKCMMYFLRFKI
jgi:hypothetical protein